MKALTILSILISIMALSLFPTYLHADDFYIDPTHGDDTNPGTFDAPWKKIAKANSSLKAGDTVYIKAGTYAETIRPANSGTSGKYITYTAYNGQNVIIGGNIRNAADLSDRTWIKIDGLNFKDTNFYWIQFSPNGSYNYIVNCDFKATGSSMSWSGVYLSSANHNKIIGNSFTASCTPGDLLYITSGSYNLIEGNYFGNANHNAMEFQPRSTTEYNIVRENTFQNLLHSNLGIWRNARYTLVEGNTILDAGDDCGSDNCSQNTCGSDKDKSAARWVHSGIQVAAKFSIIRNNVLINNGRFAMESWASNLSSTNNRVYNNTIHGNYRGWTTQNGSEYPFSDNVAKNNIFSNNREWNIDFCGNISDSSNKFSNNTLYGSSPVRYRCVSAISKINSTFPNEWQGNNQIDPGYNNVDERDLSLHSTSLLRDAGAWLTFITSSSGSGNTFIVDDAKYFSDGFGIISGDKIQIQGQNIRATIRSINYDTNTIVIDSSISWNKGDGISLPYSGDAPDIGAFEYGLNESGSQAVPGTMLMAPALNIKK